MQRGWGAGVVICAWVFTFKFVWYNSTIYVCTSIIIEFYYLTLHISHTRTRRKYSQNIAWNSSRSISCKQYIQYKMKEKHIKIAWFSEHARNWFARRFLYLGDWSACMVLCVIFQQLLCKKKYSCVLWYIVNTICGAFCFVVVKETCKRQACIDANKGEGE